MFFGRFNFKIQFQVTPKTGNVDFLTTKSTGESKEIVQRFKAPAEAQRRRSLFWNQAVGFFLNLMS